MNKKIYLLIVVILSLNLIINIVYFNNIQNKQEELNRQMISIVSDHHSISSDILSDIRNLSHQIDLIKEENKWILKQEFIPDNESSSLNEIHMNLEWSFKEVEIGADVYVLYREKSASEWKKEPANELGEGTYRAPLVLNSDKEFEYQFKTIITIRA